MLRLEQLSYYHHLSLSGGKDRPIFAYRTVDIRGSRYHVLSRIQDAGLDYSGRTNFIAHHLAFSPEEIGQLSTPAVILRDWSGWLTSWNREPQQLSNENWGNLNSLVRTTCLPGKAWRHLTGDAANGYALLETKPGTCFCADGVGESDLLTLLGESMELLELRDSRGDFKMASWQYTLTTSMQEQDNPTDFRWRFVHRDNPAFAKFGGNVSPPLASLRAAPGNSEEQSFAQKGWQAPSHVEIRLNKSFITEGDFVHLEAKADGIPYPSFSWFEIEQGKPVAMVGRSGPTLDEQPKGRAKRYTVQAYNSIGAKNSQIIELEIHQPVRLSPRPALAVSPTPVKHGPGYIKTEQEIEAQRQRLAAKNEQERRAKRHQTIQMLVMSIPVVVAICLCAYTVWAKPWMKTQLAIVPTVLNFDPTVVGNAVTTNLEFVNANRLILAGKVEAKSPFAIQGDAYFCLRPGETGHVAVSFMPTSTTNIEETIRLIWTNQFFVHRLGKECADTVKVTGGGLPQVLAPMTSLKFNDIAVGANATNLFTITNQGTVPIKIKATITNSAKTNVEGAFKLLSPDELTLNNNVNFSVSFHPTTTGLFVGWLIIEANQNYRVVLTGSATNASASNAVGPRSNVVLQANPPPTNHSNPDTSNHQKKKK